jgi:hypothetical protein
MQVYVVVFEDNMCELIDSDMIYENCDVAEAIKDNYTRMYYSDGSRKPIVQPMKLDTRTIDKLAK